MTSPARTAGARARICVVAACHDEEAGIERFHRELGRALDSLADFEARIILVDDGSQDATLERLNQIAEADPRVRVYALSRNFGHQAALSAGLDVAEGDAVVMMDSDLQHPPALIPELVARWQAGADVVSAVRRRTPDAGPAKRLSSSAFYRVLNALSDTKVPAAVADFCLLSRRAHRALVAMPERHRFLRGLVSWMGFRRELVPYDAAPRAAGAPSYGPGRMLALALDAVFSFSAMPLRIATRSGLAVVAAGVAYLAYILGRALFLGDLVPGWGSLISIALILGGAQLAFIGLLGEYIARIFDEVKGRPLYLFQQTPETRREPPPGGGAP